MIMHVSFPKDKEELKRKKLEAMMKKIASGESNAVVRPEVKLETGKEGMKKIKEITKEIGFCSKSTTSKLYQHRKTNNMTTEDVINKTVKSLKHFCKSHMKKGANNSKSDKDEQPGAKIHSNNHYHEDHAGKLIVPKKPGKRQDQSHLDLQ